MEESYYIQTEGGLLVGVYTNAAPPGAQNVSQEVFGAAREAMGKCGIDQRVAVSDDLASFSFVPRPIGPAEQLQREINTAREYLATTDWYYARKAETGDEVPADVVQKRIDAREFLRANTAAA